MTAQEADILLRNGERVPLFTSPLNPYLEGLGQGWPFASVWTANWRGYVATWEIRDGALFLVSVRGWVAKRPIHATTPLEIKSNENRAALPDEARLRPHEAPEVPLAHLFPGTADHVKAEWFSGTLRVPEGSLVHYEDMGNESIYEREARMTIECGVVTSTEVVDAVEEWRERLRVAKERLEEVRTTSVDEWGWAACPHCGQAFVVRDKRHWDGERHWCGGRIVLGGDAGMSAPP